MPTYGSITYGFEKYGIALSRPYFILDVDWNGDGAYEADNIGLRLHSLSVTRGRPYFIRKDGRGFERLGVGRLSGMLMNIDGRFNVESIDSPYYPYIPAGKTARLRVRTPSNHLWNVFAGTLDDIVPDSQAASEAAITADDGVRLLQQTVSVELQKGVRADEAIPLILEKVGWPDAWAIDLDIGATAHDFWWLDGNSAQEAIHDLVDSELGAVWLGGNGTLKFRSRYTAIPTVASLTTDDFAEGSIETPRPWEMVRNHLHVNVYPPVMENAVEVWRWQEKPYFSPGAERTVWAAFSYNSQSVPVDNAITPVAGIDYEFNTNDDGGGTDLTDDFSVVVEAVFAGSAKLLITNNGSAGGHPVLVRMRADAVTVPNETFVEVQDAASIARYQRRTFELALRWFQDSAVAQALSDYMTAFLAYPRLYVRGVIQNNMDLQFGIELGEAVDIYIPEKNIDGVYRLAWINHKSTDRAMLQFDTTMLFEPFPDLSGNYWRFDEAQVGISTIYAP